MSTREYEFRYEKLNKIRIKKSIESKKVFIDKFFTSNK